MSAKDSDMGRAGECQIPLFFARLKNADQSFLDENTPYLIKYHAQF